MDCNDKCARIGVVGCGVVGCGVISMLADKRDFLRERFGFNYKLCFVSDFVRGTLISDDGLDAAAIAHTLERDRSLHAMPGVIKEPMELDRILETVKVDFVCDMTPTNYETGAPSLGILRSALSHGASAVTCSKGGVSKDMAGLKELAAKHGVALRFESSVMSGTPLINMARGPLAGCEITRVRGIVNGTTNYILTQMEAGMDYAAALAEAQRLGYAETDPTGDVEGFDSAVKVVIMAGEFFGRHITIGEVDRTGITKVTPAQIEAARENGRRIKLIASAEMTPQGVKGSVKPTEVEMTDPLAGISGVTNAVTITTDDLGDITIVGPGAGARETAHGIVTNILEVCGCSGN